MNRSLLVGISIIALFGAGCVNDSNRASSAAGEDAPAGAATPPADEPQAALSAAEQTFVQEVAHANEMEVDLAQLAQDKSQSEKVKEYARQLEKDHSASLDEVRGVARSANLDLEEDDAARASMTNKLEGASGVPFDQQFIRQMIDNHRKNIAAFEKHQTTATGELKTYIDRTLPVLKAHLERAEALQKQIGNSPTP
jgi:putative membrane protein